MDTKNYKREYARYKNKYLRLKQQGGNLVYDPQNPNQLIMKKYENDLPIFNHMRDQRMVTLTPSETISINFFSEFILPFMFDTRTNKYIGSRASSDLSLINTGGFGVILQVDNQIIKILRSTVSRQSEITAEVMNNLLINTFEHNDHLLYINSVVTANDAGLEVNPIIKNTHVIGNVKIMNYNNIVYFDVSKIQSTLSRIMSDINSLSIDTSLIFIVMDRCQMDISNYHDFADKSSFLVRVFTDVLSGLNTLHKNNFVHCDIKPPNILVENNGNIKLIDFGGLTRVDSNGRCRPSNISPLFNNYSFFDNRIARDGVYGGVSILYDLHCLMLSLMALSDIITIAGNPDILHNTFLFNNEIFSFDYIKEHLHTIRATIREKINTNSKYDIILHRILDFLIQCQFAEKSFSDISKKSYNIRTNVDNIFVTRLEFEEFILRDINKKLDAINHA